MIFKVNSFIICDATDGIHEIIRLLDDDGRWNVRRI